MSKREILVRKRAAGGAEGRPDTPSERERSGFLLQVRVLWCVFVRLSG